MLLREEISLAEVPLGEIVVAYVDHMGEEGDLDPDLEAVTEFLVLIAALCELKSRLLLPARTVTRSSAPRRPPMSCSPGCSSTAATARRRRCSASGSSVRGE